MDINKVDLLLKYILAAAGQEDFGNWEVGPFHLVKPPFTKEWSVEWEEGWTRNYIFENEWQSFNTKKERSLELKSIFPECLP
jgi:hypothetical protein